MRKLYEFFNKKDWKNIHPNFTPKLQKEWEERGFGYDDCQEWIKFGCQPQEVDLADYLCEVKNRGYEFGDNIEVARVKYNNATEASASVARKQGKVNDSSKKILTEEVNKEQESEILSSPTLTIFIQEEEGKIVNIDDWKNIHSGFTPELQEEWEISGFSYEECERWIEIGLKPQDISFVNYLCQQHNNLERFLFSLRERGKIRGDIKNIDYFSTDFSTNCAIVISEKDGKDTKESKKFGASLLVYDKIENIPWCVKFFSDSSYQKVINKSNLLKKKLNSNDNPILAFFEVGNKPIHLSRTIKKTSIPTSISNNLDNYIKKYDIIGVKTSETSIDYVAIFLDKNKTNGKAEMAYVSSENDTDWKVKTNTWEKFLQDYKQKKEITSYRPIIPFKKSELIKRHIDIATKVDHELCEYGPFAKSNKYFATLCVGSIPFSKRINRFFSIGWLREGKLGEELLRKEIERNNKYFTDLEKKEKNLEEIIKEYYISLHKDNIIQEKIDEMKEATSEEEVNKLSEQLLSYKLSFPNLNEEEFKEYVKKLTDKQKEIINLEKDQCVPYKNILIIGRTGNGKSTLANILVNKEENFKEDGKFEEIFEESPSSDSKTKETKIVEFEINSTKYRIVDTIGIGDNKLPEEEVLDRLARTAHSIKNGLYQVLFVVGGRLDEPEKKAYELLKGTIFDEDVDSYTTIVRTNFSDFEDANSCAEDCEVIREHLNDINSVVIHVNNPSTNVKGKGERAKKEINLNKETRKESRKILIGRLETCQREKNYKPENLRKLVIKISGLVSKLEKLEKELEQKRNLLNVSNEERKEIKQIIKEKEEMVSSIKAEIYDQVKLDLKEKGVYYDKWLSEFIERKLDVKWIPYNQFAEIEHIANGGFSGVYKARWKGSNHTTWVALKILNNSQNMNIDFLQEITCHDLTVDDFGKHIVRCHGISRHPETGDYIMVMQYAEDGSLRQHLKNSYSKLSFKDKFTQLLFIVEGLGSIHSEGLIHRDFHSGNILNDYTYSFECYITDLGLCQPVNETNDGKIYGVLPYIAPEVLKEQPYTQAADIYSFGIVTYELFSGLPPYYDIAHDSFLARKICQGLRPNLDKIAIPQLLKDLINQCWNTNFKKRPTAKKIKEALNGWYWNIVHERKDTDFHRQCEEIEKANKNFSLMTNELGFLSYKTHPQATYTSRLLDFRNLPQPQNSQEINEWFWNSDKYNISKSMEFPLSELHQTLEEMNKQESTQDLTNNSHSEFISKVSLNYGQEADLRAEYQTYQQQTHTLQPPKNNLNK